MRVHVSGCAESFNSLVRAYAEYRVFAALARHAHVCAARVAMRHSGDTATVVCAVTVDLDSTMKLRARGSAPHAHAAIDRAVARVVDLMRDHEPQQLSS